MWTVIYIAPSRAIAEGIRRILSQEGILVKLQPVGLVQRAFGSFEVMVPAQEAHEAHSLLAEHIGRVRY